MVGSWKFTVPAVAATLIVALPEAVPDKTIPVDVIAAFLVPSEVKAILPVLS